MNRVLLYPYGFVSALRYAANRLEQLGYEIADHPMPEITHFLTDVPCNEAAFQELPMLPENITIIGGNLPRKILRQYKCIDLLNDEEYLCRNAAITAQCAMALGLENGQLAYCGSKVLIIGRGRIGKHLSEYLRRMGADVTVALRNPKEQALAKSSGLQVVDIPQICAAKYDLIFNTVPAYVCTIEKCKNPPTAIDLASTPGIKGENVISARGLPGKMAAKSSAVLIASRINEILRE